MLTFHLMRAKQSALYVAGYPKVGKVSGASFSSLQGRHYCGWCKCVHGHRRERGAQGLLCPQHVVLSCFVCANHVAILGYQGHKGP